MTWGWGAGESFGRLWRICTAPDANTRCEAAHKDLSVSGQVLDMRYSYDNGGNLTAIRDYLNSNQVQTFGYDHLNRLTTAYTDANGAGQYNHTYSYNQLGNLTNYDGAAYTYSTSHKHAVATAQGTTFSYDANGNMTFRNNSGTTNDYTQNFNVENELESVVVSSLTALSNGDGQLTEKREKTSNVFCALDVSSINLLLIPTVYGYFKSWMKVAKPSSVRKKKGT